MNRWWTGTRLATADDPDVFAAGEPVEVAKRTPLVDAVGAEIRGVEAEQHRAIRDECAERDLLVGTVGIDERRGHVRDRLADLDRAVPVHTPSFDGG